MTISVLELVLFSWHDLRTELFSATTKNDFRILILALQAESAIAALSCSGAVLRSLPIRVSPSKTPVRPRAPRSPLH
ncbi:hypothetical protein Patl1_05275 [Pistacia atlantica]|uniref:Uncharacterized protein n=1 Tax=Pistacia atlantica TaxID=434234 RepID=A0ACC1BVH5_9ROSI|nr:hypothetical protein Patl1_05275 [Pistacia atlantica]